MPETSQEITWLCEQIDGHAANWVKDDSMYAAISNLLLAVKYARRLDERATRRHLERAYDHLSETTREASPWQKGFRKGTP